MGYKQSGGYHRRCGIGSLPSDSRVNIVMRIEDAEWIRNYAHEHGQKIIDVAHEMVERMRENEKERS